MRIAVISDLHVSGNRDGADTWLTVETSDRDPKNPFATLETLINRESLTADVVLCCGDMAERASFAGQQYAWTRIQRIAKALGAPVVLGTAGNHDLDSRFNSSIFDAKGGLQALDPPFPGLNEAYVNQYWAKNYAIHTVEEKCVRILNINTCAFHGYGRDDAQEFLHGRVSEQTLRSIQSALDNTPVLLNVGFFHHHPIRWEEVAETDYSEMQGGNKLLDLLSSSNYGSWLLIHGHKHRPNIRYAPGGANSPVILSAGSFSSKRLATNARHNEFYLVELLSDPLETLELPLAGIIRTWRWTVGVNWAEARFEEGVPSNAGFGNRTAPAIAARAIQRIIQNDERPYYTWAEILEKSPKLKYLLPQDIRETIDILKAQFGFALSYDSLGWPSQIGTPPDN